MTERVWSEKDLVRRANRRLAVLRHAEEVSGNVAAACRYDGIGRNIFHRWKRRCGEEGLDGLKDRSSAPRKAEDELGDPRTLALPNLATLTRLADALVANSSEEYEGWGDVVFFAACTAARIGEVSGCRIKDLDTTEWKRQVRRQTTTAPGGLVDKGTKGKRARTVPLIEEIRELVLRRIALTDGDPDARLFTGPRGGRITTAVLRTATGWDEVVTKLGYEHLRRHDLPAHRPDVDDRRRVKPHDLQKIAGQASLTTTQRYLHPNDQSISDAGALLSKHLQRSTGGAQLRAIWTRKITRSNQ